MSDRSWSSLAEAHDRPAQLGAVRPAPTPPAPRPQAIAPATHPRLPDGAATHREAESRAELDLRPDPQRYDSGRARRRTKAVSVPGHPRDPRPVPTTPGGGAQLLAFLGGHQDAISKQPLISPSMNHFAPVQVRLTSRKAVWQPRPGRNPCEF